MQPGNEVFLTAYNQLNEEQKKAVDHIDGPVFVIAGPGTGKTQLLTLRIANILLKTDTLPDTILALTFTDSAVRTLRERLVSIIGERGYKVRIHTFHGFAEYLIRTYPDYVPRIIGAQLATDAERAEFLEQVLLTTPLEHLRPLGDPLYYHSHVTRAISTLKREKVTPSTLLSQTEAALASFDTEDKRHASGKYAGTMKGIYLAELKRLQKTLDLGLVYQAYEDTLVREKRYDYEDVILEVTEALSTQPEMLLQVQESMQYILADEHQDANKAQNTLLELVSGFHEQPNLCIVGDEKQAIYRFQGADLDNVHFFRNKYPSATIITLVENYRSPQAILDAARSLIESSPDTRLSRVPLLASGSTATTQLQLNVCPDADTEFATLTKNIEEALAEGITPEEIAILVRRNQDIEPVAQALERAGIAVTGGTEVSALTNRYVRALIRLLQALVTPTDAAVAQALLLPGFAVSAGDLQQAIAAAKQLKLPLIELLQSKDKLGTVSVHNPTALQEAGKLIASLAKKAAVERPAVVAEEALAKSGLMAQIVTASDRGANLGAIRAVLMLFEDLSRREHDALLPRALETIARIDARGIRVPSATDDSSTSIRLMTVHRAKGREFSRVFVPLLTSRAWSTRNRPTHFELPDVLSGGAQVEDERRLLYVAITRAKEKAVLSYAGTGVDGRPEEPSELLADIAKDILVTNTVPAVPPTLNTSEAYEQPAPTEQDRTALRATFLARGLSSTALNNYLACPWMYFYANLLRIPEAESRHRLYGISIHAALREYADLRAKGELPNAEQLISVFIRMLERSPLSSDTIADLTEEGTTAITSWWESVHDAWPEGAVAEEAISAELALPTGECLQLRGTLDLMVPTPNGVVVTDYKTGKPKSENELRGLTATGNGNYYRQLTFYKLLLERSEKREHMHEGIIEFVTPSPSGARVKHTFAIPQEDVDELIETIERVSQEILTLSFWDTPCEDKDCVWCDYRFGLVDN